jgi:hypothetical protein
VIFGWQDGEVPKASPRRGRLRTLRLIFVLLAFGLLASGCVRVHAAIAVSTDDQVSGDLVVASVPSAGNGQGPQLTIPTSLADRVTKKSYSANGYTGSELSFQDLSFEDMAALSQAISNESASYKIVFQRNGDLVTMDGSVDLSQLPPAGLDVQLKVSFPNPPAQTDGTVAGDTVSWTMKAGQVNSFSVADEYTLGNARGWRFWAAAIGGGGAIVSVFVVLLALWARRRNLKKERAYLAATA